MKDQLDNMLESLIQVRKYLPQVIPLEEFLSHRATYPAGMEFSGSFLSLYLSDIHARIRHLIQFLPTLLEVSADQQKDIINFLDYLIGNFDEALRSLENYAQSTVGAGQNRRRIDVADTIQEIIVEISNKSNFISDYYKKKEK